MAKKTTTYPEILEVSPQEYDTIIAALRFWRREGLPARNENGEWTIATERGAALSASGIDALCIRLSRRSSSP